MPNRLTRHPALPRAALFAAALIWGSSFFMMKHVVAVFPTYYLLAIRFTVAAVLLAAIFRKRLYRMRNYLSLRAELGEKRYPDPCGPTTRPCSRPCSCSCTPASSRAPSREIGRASCRERV